jgi:DNA repair photolyase
MLEVLLKHRHPVGIITKNALILRDLDLLTELASLRLVHVMVSITSLDEELRLVMEPRTVTYKNRLRVIEELTKAGIPAGVMNAPLIPGLNSQDIPSVIKAAAEHGAVDAGYTIVRLNGAVHDIFRDWLFKNFPDRGDKVWHQIMECHGGQVNDSRFGVRMRGEGKVAESIRSLFKMAVKKYMKGRKPYELNTKDFNSACKPPHNKLSIPVVFASVESTNHQSLSFLCRLCRGSMYKALIADVNTNMINMVF